MPLVSVRCPECGGTAKYDSAKRLGVCEFCRQPFIVEEAISNYNTFNQNTYNIKNADITLSDDNSVEKKLESANVFLQKLNNNKEARRLYEEVVQIAPEKDQAWWGIAQAITEGLSEMSVSIAETAFKYVQNAIRVAEPESAKVYKQSWNSYIEAVGNSVEKQEGEDAEYNELILQEKGLKTRRATLLVELEEQKQRFEQLKEIDVITKDSYEHHLDKMLEAEYALEENEKHQTIGLAIMLAITADVTIFILNFFGKDIAEAWYKIPWILPVIAVIYRLFRAVSAGNSENEKVEWQRRVDISKDNLSDCTNSISSLEDEIADIDIVGSECNKKRTFYEGQRVKLQNMYLQ